MKSVSGIVIRKNSIILYSNQVEYNVSRPVAYYVIIQGDSVARGPKLLSVYTVEQRGFLVLYTGRQVHLKHARRHFERNL